ncbi:MAG: L-ribulose-5-phosphate 4-epimerase AraD [Opitutales bacterium]|nr:L-ribulose-5-phosphate 4-epimerase AraD [Opitutales bacterium]
MHYREIREECAEANKLLPQTGLVDLTFGNVSVYDPETQVFAIKPSGVEYDELTAEDMVIVHLSGKVVEGELRPSSDTPTHRRIFQEFAEAGVRSVVHTHSRAAVAFAQAGQPIPCLGTTHCDYFYGSVPVTRTMTRDEVQGEYEWDTAKVIAEAFEGRNPMDCPAVLVQNHGPFTWGSSGKKAVENAQALEIVADMAIRALSINPEPNVVPTYLLDKHFFRKHGANAYYGQK